jgi:hypothetical protein
MSAIGAARRTGIMRKLMDWRLGLLMDLQLASQTPVIEP